MSFLSTNSSLRTMLGYLATGSLFSQVHSAPAFTEVAPNMMSNVKAVSFDTQAQTCPANGPISCQSSASPTCCFLAPGGQVLQTQFWDYSPAVGPADSWGLHGLWPDLCDGSYDQYCKNAPQYYNITQILKAAGQTDLLTYMDTYWQPDSGSAESFWEHEWNKHGTCYNTLAPSCYGDSYEAGQEVVDFFSRTVAIFKGLDTYTALANAGIVPDSQNSYAIADIQAALTAVTGSQVTISCTKGALSQVFYGFNVQGSIQTGNLIPVDVKAGTCPKDGIMYYPKGN